MLKPEWAYLTYGMLPRNGAKSIWSYCVYDGEIVPIVAFDEREYCIVRADGTSLWVEKARTESIFAH